MLDVAVPLVFPDYLIAVDTPPVRVDVPNWLPGVPNQLVLPGTHNRLPYLGHAGILFFNGGSGVTKYYEYGRYDRQPKAWCESSRFRMSALTGRGARQMLLCGTPWPESRRCPDNTAP